MVFCLTREDLDKFEEEVLSESVNINVHEIELVSVDDVSIDGLNPNKMNTKQFEALKENIKKYGFLNPVICNKDLLVADGEHRFLAAKELGMEKVPVFRLDVKEVDRRILRQVLNKLHGDHDKRLDFEEFKYLMDNNALNSLQDLLGAEDSYLVQFVAGMHKPDLNPDVIPEISESTSGVGLEFKVSKGDLIKLGDHYLLCGDATVEEDVKRLVGESTVDMVFTDPPYNVNYEQFSKKGKKEAKIDNDNMNKEQFIEFLKASVGNMFKVNKGTFYICMSNKELTSLMNVFEELGGHWSSTIIWNKSSFVLGRSDYHRKYEPILYGFKEDINSDYEPILYGWVEGEDHYFNGDRSQSDVWDIEKPVKNDLHPTMKPVALCERAITNSTKPGMTVLDLFGGSGSTLIAAERMNRKCLMMELDTHFCEVIIARWQNMTGLTVEKI